MRLLLCIVHAALDGPKPEDWRRVPDLLPAAAEAYLRTWQESFELFHPTKPFLQLAGLQSPAKDKDKGKNKTSNAVFNVSKMDFSLATKNNSTFFDHDGALALRSVSAQTLAINLLTFQCFALGGGKSSSVLPGQTDPKNFSDSLCCVASMLHSFWRGSNLADTLHRNLCDRRFIEERYQQAGFASAWGRPVWEQMPIGLDDTDAVTNATSTYLGRLVPLSRLVLLRSDCATMLLGAGLVYKNYNNKKIEFVEEPTATTILRESNKEQPRPLLSINPDKAVWRELHALLAHRSKDDPSGKTRGFWAAGNSLGGQAHDVLGVGMARVPGKASVVDVLESVFHVPALMCAADAHGREVYAAGVERAEKVASRVSLAVDRYRQTVDGGWQGRLKGAGTGKRSLLDMLHHKALSFYWTAAEQHLPLLFACVESLGSAEHPNAKEAWRKSLWAAAHQAYRLACAPRSPRQFKAFAKGLSAFGTPADHEPATSSSLADEEVQS